MRVSVCVCVCVCFCFLSTDVSTRMESEDTQKPSALSGVRANPEGHLQIISSNPELEKHSK